MNFIKQAALAVGFDACGIAKAEALTDDAIYLKQWLLDGCHADMNFLDRNFEKRTDPRKLVPDCKSIVVVLMNYFPDKKQVLTAPQIAKYAYSEIDYHLVLKTKLLELEKIICDSYGADCVSSDYQHLFVDSAPVLEKRWAERAGLGWIGKHTQLIHPGLGSYTFIGVLMLNFETNYDSQILNRCGTCTRCIDACPTNALLISTLDARRCISYLTIESKKEIPLELKSKLSSCAFGCDICADVCPWNTKWSKPNTHSQLSPILDMLEWNATMWNQLSKEQFEKTFKQSAIQRAGYEKLKNNIS